MWILLLTRQNNFQTTKIYSGWINNYLKKIVESTHTYIISVSKHFNENLQYA